MNYSPGVALNRIYALYKVRGPRAALREAEGLNLEDDHFYYVLLGELYRTVDPLKAKESFRKALSLAGTQTEKQGIQEKIESLA